MRFELSRPIDYSNETLLQEIIRVSKLVERPLTRTKFDKNSKYRASTIEKKFGGRQALLLLYQAENILMKKGTKIY